MVCTVYSEYGTEHGNQGDPISVSLWWKYLHLMLSLHMYIHIQTDLTYLHMSVLDEIMNTVRELDK